MYQIFNFTKVVSKKLLPIIFLLAGLSAQAQFRMYSFNSDVNGKKSIKYSKSGFDKFALKYEGEITLSDDDKDIVGLSDGGYFEVKKSVFGSKRKVVIETDGDGRLIKKYYTGFSQKDYDPEGRIWLGAILPNVVRTTNLGAKKRVERFYNQGGAQAVFDEVELLESDNAAYEYLQMVLEKDLDTDELESLLRLAGEKIGSDHHLAELLQHNQKDYFASSASVSAYINATKRIGSDHHMAEILNRAIENSDLSDDQVAQLFEITKSIGSDHHMAQVLIHVLRTRELNDKNLNLLIENTRKISSDHHKTDVLLTALKLPELSPHNYYAFIQALDDISSDHHLSQVFYELLEEDLNSDELGELLKLAGESIGSDLHLSGVLTRAVRKQNLEENNLAIYLEALESVSSDLHAASVVSQLAREDLSDTQLIKILPALDEISSDLHLSSVLRDLAPLVNGMGEDVKQAYRDACKSISSDIHYGAAIRAID